MVEPEAIPRRLVLSVVDDDPDYLLLEVSVADGAFAGSTRVYESRDVAAELRSALAGFPRKNDDRREVVLGSFGPTYAGGAVRLVFRTINRAGHCVLEAELEDEPTTVGSPRTVTIRLPVDSASLDSFLQSLGRITPMGAGTAVLHGVV
jgi:hypothetical protein